MLRIKRHTFSFQAIFGGHKCQHAHNEHMSIQFNSVQFNALYV